MTDDSQKIPRREFLSTAWAAMLMLAAGGTGYMGIRFLTSQPIDGEIKGTVTAGLVDDFPPGSIAAFEKNRFYLVRREDGGFVALYNKCTHLACTVLLDKAAGEFYCPCHGSRFHTEGAVLNPPAPETLKRFPVSFEGGAVIVDTATPLPHDHADVQTVAYPGGQEAES